MYLSSYSRTKFIDGRFFFPSDSVRWQYLEDSGRRAHMNPIGPVRVFDIVFRSQSKHREKNIVARNRGSVLVFEEARRTWTTMRGFTCFQKGVDILFKPHDFKQTILPGEVRIPGGALAHVRSENFVWEDFAVALDETTAEGDCVAERDST